MGCVEFVCGGLGWFTGFSNWDCLVGGYAFVGMGKERSCETNGRNGS